MTGQQTQDATTPTPAQATTSPQARRYWKISPGAGASEWSRFLERGIIAMRWAGTPDLGKVAPSSAEDIEALEEVSTRKVPGKVANQLWSFYHEMRPGDLVCAYGRSQVLGWGEITGEYRHEDDGHTFAHRRDVQWLSQEPLPTSELTPSLRGKLKRYTTIVPLTETEFAEIQERRPARRAWLFSASPEHYQSVSVGTARSGDESDEVIKWANGAPRHGLRPHAGDIALLWQDRAGRDRASESGLLAVGHLVSEPQDGRARFRYELILPELLRREELASHPVLGQMEIMRTWHPASFPLKPLEWTELQKMIHGHPQAEIQSPGTPPISERRLQRQSEDAARSVFESLFPEPRMRFAYLSLLADSIDLAHQLGPAAWGVTMHTSSVRLNVGRVQSLFYRQGEALLLVDNGALSPEQRERLADRLQSGMDWYRSVPAPTGEVRFWGGDIEEVLPLVGEANRSLVRKAVTTVRATPYSNSHSPGILQYLRTELSRTIPNPIYVPSDDAASADTYTLIRNALNRASLHFTPWQVATFYTALQVKGFAILSGISGTGKTKLAQAFAEMLPQPSSTPALSEADAFSITVHPSLPKFSQMVIPKKVTLLFNPLPPNQPRKVLITFDGGSEMCSVIHQSYNQQTAVKLIFSGKAGQWAKSLVVGDRLTLQPELDADQNLTGLRLHRTEEQTAAPSKEGETPSNLLFVPVRPDWRDSKSLLGYHNPLTGAYEWTPFLRFLTLAARNYREEPSKRLAWFVILDEMNLAHVEYYFADLLSVLESGRNDEGWTREPLRFTYPEDAELEGDAPPRELLLPPNLYVVGTVNVDETTHAFSPKVLDRAFTIEFTEVDFAAYPPEPAEHTRLGNGEKRAILADFTQGGAFERVEKQAVAEYVDTNPEVRKRLQRLNELLAPHNLHFGYRVFDEIATFLANAEENAMFEGIPGPQPALDAAVLMKVLPKFHGSRARLEAPLAALLAWCADPDAPHTESVADALEKATTAHDLPSLLPVSDYRCPRTAERALRMLQTLHADGFAAFG